MPCTHLSNELVRCLRIPPDIGVVREPFRDVAKLVEPRRHWFGLERTPANIGVSRAEAQHGFGTGGVGVNGKVRQRTRRSRGNHEQPRAALGDEARGIDR